MLLDSLSIPELFLLNLTVLIVILFLIFQWFFGQVREICKEPEGIIKFGQITFILLSWSCFLFILIYFIINPEGVHVLNVFLTIIVGFLGTIMGLFFNRETIEKLKITSEYKSNILKENKELLGDAKELLKEILKGKKLKD
jgi:hypothetical protein|tara:strand:- start:236 stop:658 length:423 start_codon:yes stop_codon:yes gene_type:complete